VSAARAVRVVRAMLVALAAGGPGLVAGCSGEAGDELGGSVRLEWRIRRPVPGTARDRDSSQAGKAGAAPDSSGGAARDTAASAQRGAKPGTKPDSTTGAQQRTAAPARPAGPGASHTAAGDTASNRAEGSMQGRGTVVWCPSSKLAIITGVQGDTGVGLVVHPRDSLVPGTYPIRDADSARTTAPAAAVALRLMSRNAIEGYQGLDGALTITDVRDRRFSGKLRADVDVVGGVRRLDLQGELRDLPIAVGGAACPS
jgi:hypothetical protein